MSVYINVWSPLVDFIQSFRAGLMLVMKCVLAVALFHPKPLQVTEKRETLGSLWSNLVLPIKLFLNLSEG